MAQRRESDFSKKFCFNSILQFYKSYILILNSNRREKNREEVSSNGVKKERKKKKGIFNSISMRLRLSENNELGAQFGAGLVQDGQPAGF